LADRLADLGAVALDRLVEVTQSFKDDLERTVHPLRAGDEFSNERRDVDGHRRFHERFQEPFPLLQHADYSGRAFLAVLELTRDSQIKERLKNAYWFD
jgi:hypothetical protein